VTEPRYTISLAEAPVVSAPDGSTVRVLVASARGSMARFELETGRTTRAVRHRTVEELWTVVEGRGELWRRTMDGESVVTLEPGVGVVMPVGASFQFRSLGPGTLAIVAVTMPPWPGDDEAEIVEGAAGW
jgi:mannose-6-phosphate isomerase-like protein (cupin superfamily)